MDEKIKLDPRKITGIITEKTPLFVLDYIAKFIKINYDFDNIIKFINDFEYTEIEIPNIETDDRILSKIIKFISPYPSSSHWDYENIILGLDHLLSFSLEYDLPSINLKKIKFSEKTNDDPCGINEIILFRIAKSYNYPTDKNTNIDELISFIHRISSSKIENLRNSLLFTISSMNDVELLKLYHLTGNLDECDEIFKLPIVKSSNNVFESDMFELTLDNFFNTQNILNRIRVKTNHEAIIVAAMKYEVNIIDSKLPMKEIENLSRSKYIPYCQSFARKYSQNRNFYNINETWTVEFSNNRIYSIDRMREFTLIEGFDKISSLSFNELNNYMKSSRNMFNFYFGRNPNINETSTVFLTPLNELKNNELICFGTLSLGDLKYISVTELTEHFLGMKMFIDPVNNKVIDKRVINKLKNYCKNINVNYETDKLLSAIGELEKMEKLMDGIVYQLKKYLLRCDMETHKNIKNFFNNSMELGLYMRGWKVVDCPDLPLESEHTIYNESETVKVNEDIDESIYAGIQYCKKQKVFDNTSMALERTIESLMILPPDVVSEIKKLHILKFNTKETPIEILGYLFKGVRVYQDETLVDCMKNIFKGMDNEKSCMRTNSNWILFSTVWYMILFSFEIPFKIDRIGDIR